MTNGLLDALKTINTTVHYSSLTIQRLSYVCYIFQTLADIDHRLSQLCNGHRKLESDVSIIYSYINTLSSKIVTQAFINHVDLKSILNNIQTIIPSYLSFTKDPSTNIWSFYQFIKMHPLVFNDTLVISLIVPLVDNTFHLQLYCTHTVPMVNTTLHKTSQINLKHLCGHYR